MAAFSASKWVCDAMSSMVFTISEISSERSARLLTFREIRCTSPRMRCIPVRLARTACSPFVAASKARRADDDDASASSATRRIERVSVSMALETETASRDWVWAPPAVCSMASIISLALARTCCAASRTSSMIVASSPTITLMASTTLPRTSEVT